MEKMRTADEMINFCRKKKTGGNYAHFKPIEKFLDDDEFAVVCFGGLQNVQSLGEHDGNYAYALTNKRLIIAQKQMLGNSVRVIRYEDLNDITAKDRSVVIDAVKWEPNLRVVPFEAEAIQAELDKLMPIIKAKKRQMQTSGLSDTELDKLGKLKELRDNGVLTEEEFLREKKTVLEASAAKSDSAFKLDDELEGKYDSEDSGRTEIKSTWFDNVLTIGAVILIAAAVIWIFEHWE